MKKKNQVVILHRSQEKFFHNPYALPIDGDVLC